MRNLIVLAAILLSACHASGTAPMSSADRSAVGALPSRLTAGWLHNDSQEVMGLFAPEAVFIPHDGVVPHVGKAAINDFWFPATGAAGKVTAFTMTTEGLTGDSETAIVWGKSDLHWQDDKTAYHWPGYYLIAAERRNGKWLVTHLMSSDEQPTSHPVKTP